MKPKLLLSLALILGGSLTGYFRTAQAGEPSTDTREIIIGNTGFAIDLYGQLRTREGNLFFSPYSISTALAMTCGGARGETEEQMARTFHFTLPPDELHPAFAALAADFRAVQSSGNLKLAEANSLWPQQGFAFLPDYLDLCRKYYGIAIKPVDYAEHTEAARKTINDWVEDRTNRKIVELLQPGTVDGSCRLVLVNAIYFKGKWDRQFEAGLTGNEPFHLSAQKTITAPLMRQLGDFRYAESPGLQVLELPYHGGGLSMLVLLPGRVEGLGHLEAALTAKKLTSWTAGLQSRKVNVFLPKFKMTARFSLAETLKALGMTDAFNASQADFSGMDGRKDLFISKVEHQAFVEVNEEGTEAAAATAVVVSLGAAAPSSRPIPVLRADHPFLFLIRDNRNGSILFLGRITDPTQ